MMTKVRMAMGRLIDADALLPNGVFYVNASNPMTSIDELLNRINNAPTVDAVPVVRCKDCKWRGGFGCPMYSEEIIERDDDGYREVDFFETDNALDDGFCDRGERSDNDE